MINALDKTKQISILAVSQRCILQMVIIREEGEMGKSSSQVPLSRKILGKCSLPEAKHRIVV